MGAGRGEPHAKHIVEPSEFPCLHFGQETMRGPPFGGGRSTMFAKHVASKSIGAFRHCTAAARGGPVRPARTRKLNCGAGSRIY